MKDLVLECEVPFLKLADFALLASIDDRIALTIIKKFHFGLESFMFKLTTKITAIFFALSIAACGGGGSSASNSGTSSSGASTLAPGEWRANKSVVPSSGNYVYLSPNGDDFVSSGTSSFYSNNNALFSGISRLAGFSLQVNGDETWYGEFQMPLAIKELKVGLYQDLRRYPFHNLVKGGLTWFGNGNGCNQSTGWLAIDAIEYEYGIVKSVELRFEQFCENSDTSLRGQIRWRSPYTEGPPDSNGFWKANPAYLPSTGNFIHLSSQPGDYIGAGQIQTYTNQNAGITVVKNKQYGSDSVQINVDDGNNWMGFFAAPLNQNILSAGVYINILDFPSSNPVFGALSWSGAGRGCNSASGWFIVDKLTVVNEIVTALDLRFEQHCDSYQGAPQELPALRGQIHWRAP